MHCVERNRRGFYKMFSSKARKYWWCFTNYVLHILNRIYRYTNFFLNLITVFQICVWQSFSEISLQLIKKRNLLWNLPIIINWRNAYFDYNFDWHGVDVLRKASNLLVVVVTKVEISIFLGLSNSDRKRR